MTTVPIPCPTCATVVQVDKSTYDDHDELNVSCPKGHTFDYVKPTCPECGSAVIPGYWAPRQAWFGHKAPDLTPVFHPAECTNKACDWEGSKNPPGAP
jgi:hypothetical protein